MAVSILNQFKLSGQSALVVGGNRGLGIEICQALAEAGANIAIAARDMTQNQIAQKIITDAYPVKCISFECDVSNKALVNAAVAVTEAEFGKIDILVNSAGINVRGSIEDVSLEDFNRVIEINVSGSWLTCKAVVPIMKKNGYGRIVNIGSIFSNVAMADRTPYATSKGAIINLTRALALEVAKENITVNAMLPGPFATEMNLPLTNDPVKFKEFLSKIPMGRWGELHEIGALALFLSSPASSFVTGAGIAIDGGWLAQ
ncbi:MAG: SDR family oxidoreductase [Bacteroidetes bacterium]|nr:SDR family oxidoreductase [Bacteroidota bacterium]MDA1119891.1 SDR family oxidoreductase [Bacteroidota bacterium]